MPQELTSQNDIYRSWITEVKSKIRSTQMKAIIAVNSALIHFYWEIGSMIAEKIESSNWGDKILEQVSADLKAEFPEMKGLSRSNLAYTKQFYLFYNSSIAESVQQVVGQIPWVHNILIFNKSKNRKEARFYISQTIENGWSRDTLALQIKSNLCRDKNNVEAEFALRDINKPMGVSEFDLTTILPNELKSSLPTIEEIETTLLENN